MPQDDSDYEEEEGAEDEDDEAHNDITRYKESLKYDRIDISVTLSCQ